MMSNFQQDEMSDFTRCSSRAEGDKMEKSNKNRKK